MPSRPEQLPETQPTETTPKVIRIPTSLRLHACERLVTGPNRRQNARSLISSADNHGINLDYMWGSIPLEDDIRSPRVRQVCLAVIGAGRTAMLFHSSPESPRTLGSREQQSDEIGRCISVCLNELGQMDGRVGLAQSLFEPDQHWAREACKQAQMTCVGELAYMRKPLIGEQHRPAYEPKWPEGVRVRPLRATKDRLDAEDRQMLIHALESSYVETLDCPELCGIRSMDDVIESHMATGKFDADRWLLILKEGEPVGCCLLTHCPANQSIELVYLGIAPTARGLGLGKTVLRHGISRLIDLDAREVTCAVDTRNTPAIRLYQSLGFSRFDSRIGYVARIPMH